MSRVSAATSIESSPRRDVTTSPSAPTQSPTSRLATTSWRALVELVVLEQQLDAARLVVEVGELELAVTPDRQEATGDAGLRAGVGIGREVGVRGVQLGGGGRAVEPVGVDGDTGGRQRRQLGAPFGDLLVDAVAPRAAVVRR